MVKSAVRLGALLLLAMVILAGVAQVSFAAPYCVSVTTTAEKIANPGDFVTQVYTITNTGSSNDEYQLALTAPAGWLTLGIPSSIQVSAGASEKLFITFVVPAAAQAGTYEATLMATSIVDPSVTASATALITISSVFAVEAAWIREPPRAQPGGSTQGTFSITNTGNIANNYSIKVSSTWNCKVVPSESVVMVFPGETREIGLTVSVPASLTPGSRYSATLEIASIDQPDILTGLVHFSRVAPPPPEEVGGSLFPAWPVDISLSFSKEGLTSVSFSGSGELEGIGTFSASTSVTPTSLAVPTGSFSTDNWRISLAGAGISGGFGSVSGEGSGVSLFGNVGTDLSGTLVITEEVKGFSVSCRWKEGSLRLVSGSDVTTDYSFQEIQFAQRFSDLFSLTGSVATVNEQTSSGSAFRINPQVTVEGYRLEGRILHVSSGFPNRSQEQAYGMTLSYSKPRIAGGMYAESPVEHQVSSLGIVTWSLALDGSKVHTQSDGTTMITWTKTAAGNVAVSLPFGISAKGQFEKKKSDDIPRSVDESSFGLNMRVARSLSGIGNYSLSLSMKQPIDRVADTRFLDTAIKASVGFSLAQAEVSSSLEFERIIDLDTGLVESDTSSFSASLSLPHTESNPNLSLSVSDGSASLGIGLSWAVGAADVGAAVSIPLSEGGAFSASISTRFSIALPFFGQAYGRVTGNAFVDANENGLFDPGEEPIPDLLLTLIKRETITWEEEGVTHSRMRTVVEQEAITGPDGRFVFWPVLPGVYELSVKELPFGFTPLRSLPLSLQLSTGEHQVLLPFKGYSSISGIVYNDANKNGRKDPGELGIPSVTLLVTGAFAQEQASTSASGRFNIKVDPGQWEVSLVESSLPKRFVPTTPATVRVDVGQRESTRVEFGAYEKPREIIFTFGPPTARFEVTPKKLIAGEEVVFDASASEAIGVELVSYEWSFQHAETSFSTSGQRVTVRFSKPGKWQVTLSVKDANGSQDSQQVEVVVDPAG